MSISIHALRVEGDLADTLESIDDEFISIHALRVEGDTEAFILFFAAFQFLSTPSGWRATILVRRQPAVDPGISIHALRVEGDVYPAVPT